MSSAFEDLLDNCARLTDRTLIPKIPLKREGVKPIIPDATVVLLSKQAAIHTLSPSVAIDSCYCRLNAWLGR